MRGIKFRIWDSRKKNWLNNDNGDYVLENDGIITQITVIGEYDGKTFYDFITRRDLILVQYTGLKDKNGKEIYEGDIVKYIDRNLSNAFDGQGEPWETKIMTIKWFRYGWIVPMGFVKEIEVMGNVYENPNLLEGK